MEAQSRAVLAAGLLLPLAPTSAGCWLLMGRHQTRRGQRAAWVKTPPTSVTAGAESWFMALICKAPHEKQFHNIMKYTQFLFLSRQNIKCNQDCLTCKAVLICMKYIFAFGALGM